MVCCGILEIPRRPFDNREQPAYLHFVKMNKRFIKTHFNNLEILTTKIHVLLFPRLCNGKRTIIK